MECPFSGVMDRMDVYMDSISDARSKVYLTPYVRSVRSVGLLTMLYLLMVFLGPRIMKHRRPFSLKNILIVYNAVQVAGNSYFVISICKNILFTEHFNFFCQPIFYNRMDEFGKQAYYHSMFYLSLKVLDLLDTLFFVLRKKNNQISFLHVVHHSSVVLIMWFALLVYPGGTMGTTSTINAFVHVVMYAYYLLTALKLSFTNFIKSYITTLQLVQFVFNTAHLSLSTAFGDCDTPVAFQSFIIFINVFFFWLFMQFYREAYSEKKGKDKKTK